MTEPSTDRLEDWTLAVAWLLTCCVILDRSPNF